MPLTLGPSAPAAPVEDGWARSPATCEGRIVVAHESGQDGLCIGSTTKSSPPSKHERTSSGFPRR